MNRSIIITVALNLITQWIIFGSFYTIFRFPSDRIALYAIVTLAVHLGVAILLLRLRSMFRRVDDQSALNRVNFANVLTLFRLFALPTILFLVIEWDQGAEIGIPLLILMVITFLTDMFDGIASRSSGNVTEIGKVLDSFADYMSLYILTVSFFLLNIINDWLFILVLLRGLMVWTGLAILALRYGSVEMAPTRLGKVSIFAIMTLFAFEIFVFLIPWLAAQNSVVLIIEGVATVIILLSMVDKVKVFLRTALSSTRPVKRV